MARRLSTGSGAWSKSIISQETSVSLRSGRRLAAAGGPQWAPRWAMGGVRAYNTQQDDVLETLKKDLNTPPPLDGADEVPAHIAEIVDKVAGLNMLEVMMLSKALGSKFGVDVDAMLSGGFGGGGGGGAAPAAAAAEPEAEPEPEAPSSFTVRITAMEGGVKGKFAVVKILRALKPDMSLQDVRRVLPQPRLFSSFPYSLDISLPCPSSLSLFGSLAP